MIAVSLSFNPGHTTVDLKLALSIPSVFFNFLYISLTQISRSYKNGSHCIEIFKKVKKPLKNLR